MYEQPYGNSTTRSSSLPEALSAEGFLHADTVFDQLLHHDWDFTEATGYEVGHDIHPYPAKFISLIPRHLIRYLSLRGELVVDPFGGSGTTALEAIRLGRRVVSLDANPLSQYIGRAKTMVLQPDDNQSLDALVIAIQTMTQRLVTNALSSMELLSDYRQYIPPIPHLEKWFHPVAIAELAYLRGVLLQFCSPNALNIGYVALSRTVSKVSNQASETRYVALPKRFTSSRVCRVFLRELTHLRDKTRQVIESDHAARFTVADARDRSTWGVAPNSAALIVTSPPYPNAYDYHLYHRFRLFWLGHDPAELRSQEIGSHLRHQSRNTGFDEYCEEMRQVLNQCYQALIPGRYAVFVIGDGLYDGTSVDAAQALLRLGQSVGFSPLGRIPRQLPVAKRSVTSAGRRLTAEDLVVLQKPDQPLTLQLSPPNYTLWDYETVLRTLEIQAIASTPLQHHPDGTISTTIPSASLLPEYRKLTFTHTVHSLEIHHEDPTWQALLEQTEAPESRRKEPKYVTHGIHPYKGKFYPQLAKSLLNLSHLSEGSVIWDPFMGSGTVLLESALNGFRGYGMDINPLAALITQVKVQSPEIAIDTLETGSQSLMHHLAQSTVPLDYSATWTDLQRVEIERWFPVCVLRKLAWILTLIRALDSSSLRDFFTVCLSSIIRSVSFQDPHDLRIRRRKDVFDDAPVCELFTEQVTRQIQRLRQFSAIRAASPYGYYAPTVAAGDARQWDSVVQLGVHPQVLTHFLSFRFDGFGYMQLLIGC